MVCNSHRPQRHCICPKLMGLNLKVLPAPLSGHSWLAESPSSGCQSQLSVLTGVAIGNGRRASLFCYFAWKGRFNFTLSCILLAYTLVPDHVWSVDLCTWLHFSVLAGSRHTNCLWDLQRGCVGEHVWQIYSNVNCLWEQWCWLIYILAYRRFSLCFTE